MPKEITHFALARELARALPGTSRFHGPVADFPNLFLLGNVAPDIFYFYLAGPDKDAVQKLGQPFHLPTALALGPVTDFLAQDASSPALALGAGVVCHIVSDTVFHPLVYYYAGMDGIHPGATGRHRQFETAMDLHFWYLFSGETRLDRVVKGVEIPKEKLIHLLAGLFRPSPLPAHRIWSALGWFKRIQALFGAKSVQTAVNWLDRSGYPLPPVLSGLVYPFGRPVRLPFFAGDIVYQDPCSGERVSTDLRSMAARAVESGIRVLDVLSRALPAGGMDRPDAGPGVRNRVLSDPGLPQIRPDLPVRDAKTWHRRQDIMPLLYRGLNFPA